MTTLGAASMIVGYVLGEGWFCPSCWRNRKRPTANAQLKRERNEPDDEGIVLAACTGCGQEIRYVSLLILD